MFSSGDSYEEDLKIMIWKTTSKFFQFFHNVSLSYGRIKLHTKNQPPNMFSSGDSCEEDLKIRIWKTTSHFKFFLTIFLLIRL